MKCNDDLPPLEVALIDRLNELQVPNNPATIDLCARFLNGGYLMVCIEDSSGGLQIYLNPKRPKL